MQVGNVGLFVRLHLKAAAAIGRLFDILDDFVHTWTWVPQYLPISVLI